MSSGGSAARLPPRANRGTARTDAKGVSLVLLCASRSQDPLQIRHKVYPSMYEGTREGGKASKKCSAQSELPQNGIGRGRLRCTIVLRKRSGPSTTPANVFFLYARSITGPQFQSALSVSCGYIQVLGSLACPCKFLKTLVIHTLKRLASGVQLPPWPPHFQSLRSLAAGHLVTIGHNSIH